MSGPQQGGGGAPRIASAGELLAHALAIETAATERYEELADQMEVHNNPEVAELFRKMAAIEGKHVDHVNTISAGFELPHIAPWDFCWKGMDSPEEAQPDDVHYLMTPHQAIQLALRCERQAVEFFAGLAAQVEDEEVATLARRLGREEEEHVALLEQWLARLPEPAGDWAEDPDPPALQE